MGLAILADPSRRVVGAKQTMKALTTGEAELVIVAGDADSRVTGPIREKCKELQVKLEEIPTMSELGAACSIQVRAAVAAVLRESKDR